MGASLRTKPRLVRFTINRDGSHSETLDGKYALAQESQWLVDRQHAMIQALRKDVRTLRQRVIKLSKQNAV